MQAGGRDLLSGAYYGVVRRASSCPVFQYEVRDFRRGAGSENMVDGFIFKMQLVGFVTIVKNHDEALGFTSSTLMKSLST